MGKSISQHVLPEYEVIHFILSYEAAEAELPHLLVGRDPQSRSPNEIGPDYAQNIAADMKKVLKQWRDGGAKDEEILVY
ncbi:hypothetical protein N7527_008103 [Penicillium freii]|nr:hypothetical protein N7527_008103 [Penicillium freii]